MNRVEVLEHMIRSSLSCAKSCYILADVKENRFSCSIRHNDKFYQFPINIDDPVDNIVKNVVDSFELELL